MRNRMWATTATTLLFLHFNFPGAVWAQQGAAPPPPKPEPIEVTELPLPPAAPTGTPGACTASLNPHRTGCIDPAPYVNQSGSFLPDGHHVIVLVHFWGAPTAPDPASVYDGSQIILIKADGTKFSNGDSWKCLTCGVPGDHAMGMNQALDYPQSFTDGKRILAGTNILDCAPYALTADACTAKALHIYPIRWEVRPDDSGPGGMIRELRLHPDNVHLGFNAMSLSGEQIGQFGYIGRLEFQPSPTTGTPLAPRYVLKFVNGMYRDGNDNHVLMIDPKRPDHLKLNFNAIEVGEFRGFSGDGREAFYIGYPFESSNIDLSAVDLVTGRVRRVTSDPEYVDPVGASPDNKWLVIEDTRGSGRQMFLAAMRGVPPLTDLITTGAVSSVRNNGMRRYFQPFLLDWYGDRGSYTGQRINAGDGTPGSASDPNWNAMADPRWSPDGTRVVYWQSLVTSPACGGPNPLPCPTSTEPGGRRGRVMMARFTSRQPVLAPKPAVLPDSLPWGTRYVPGATGPVRTEIPPGTYRLEGKVSGFAVVTLSRSAGRGAIDTVAVDYHDYSDMAGVVLNGSERVTGTMPTPTMSSLDWHSNLVETGAVHATKVTSADGFHLNIDVMTNHFIATGTLTTTVDGRTYVQPLNDQ